MERIFFVLALTTVFLYATFFRQDRLMIREIENKMDFAMQVASHDVALIALEYPNASQGDTEGVINRNVANRAFRNALKSNLYLNENLEPQNGTYLRYPIRIIEEQCFDVTNTTFPFVYTNQKLGLVYNINGPSCVFAIQTNAPDRYRPVSYHGSLTSAVKVEMKINAFE